MKDEMPEKPVTQELSRISPEYFFLTSQVASLSAEITALRGFIYELKKNSEGFSPDALLIIDRLNEWAKITEEFNRPITFKEN